IQQQQPWAAHQGARECEHLALTPRQRSRQLLAAFGKAREALIHFLLHLLALVLAAQEAAKLDVVLNRHRPEQLALFRHEAQAGSDARFNRAWNRLAIIPDLTR